jgi:hypothetical protein
LHISSCSLLLGFDVMSRGFPNATKAFLRVVPAAI